MEKNIMAGLGALLIFLLGAPLCHSLELGGWQPTNKNTQHMKNVLSFCVAEHNKRTSHTHEDKIIAFEEAQAQVVNGMNYKLTVVLENTNCKKGTGPHREPCPIEHECCFERCIFIVYEERVSKKLQFESEKC